MIFLRNYIRQKEVSITQVTVMSFGIVKAVPRCEPHNKGPAI